LDTFESVLIGGLAGVCISANSASACAEDVILF